jgi:hypothetical protein
MNLSPLLRQRFFDANGVPLAGGQLFSYVAGTTTPQATYSNPSGTTNANPVILDANGYADVWLNPAVPYKFVLEDANNNVLWTVDNVQGGGVRTVTTNTTLLVTDGVVRSNSTGGSLTHTLPLCSTSPVGLEITVKDVGTGGNGTTIQGSGSDNVDGSNVYATVLSQYDSRTFMNNGTSWDVF